MSGNDSHEEIGSYNPVQYGFFTAEGGQWVFRGESVADIHVHIQELLEAVDETDAPGLLSDLQMLKAAGILKEGKNPAQNAQASGSAGGGNFPDWVLSEAAKIAGRAVGPDEIKQGIAKSGRNAGQPWYKYGESWLNKPRG